MPYSPGICKIIIENIELLEESPAIVEYIQKDVFKAINRRFEQFFQLKDDWKGDYTYYEEEGDEETYFLPKNWPEPADEEGLLPFSYDFCPINGGKDYEYFLTALTGKTNLDNYAICFNINDINSCGMNKRQLRDFLQKKYLSVPELKSSNVQLKGEHLFVPIYIDPKKLLEEYPDFDECLQPVDDALKNLLVAHTFIDEIVQELRNK